MAAAAPTSNRWLWGPVPDLVLGCGLGYVAIFAALAWAGPGIRAALPLGLLPLVSVFAGTPHYGATLLRVYEQRSERIAYAFFTVYGTAVVWSLYVAGLYDAALGSFLLSLYLTWSPWHYTGQNYGIALLFLRRRGIEVTPRVKRLIYTSFVLSYALTFLAVHGDPHSADYAPVPSYGGSIYRVLRLGLPSPGWEYAFAAVGIAYLAALAAAARELLQRAAWRDLVPSALVASTQLLWFSLPPLGRELGLLRGLDPFAPDQAAFVFVWIAAGHAFQYLWVTSYYAGKRRAGALWRYYAKCVCAGSAIWSVPAIAYVAWKGWVGPTLGGVATGEDAGVLLAAMVNIHHFMLDGAIWKLRDGRVARALIRRDAAIGSEPLDRPRRRWLEPVLLTAGALWTLSTIGALVERERAFTRELARGNLAAAEASLARLAWIRRDSLADYHRLAQLAIEKRDRASALRLYDRAIERFELPASWQGKGMALESQRDVEGAAAAYEAGLRRAPAEPGLLFHLGRLRLEQGRMPEAAALLERAHAAAPDDKRVEMALERARQALAGEAGPSAGGAPASKSAGGAS
jgi:tetratricopeptide (TPR) repeat protein